MPMSPDEHARAQALFEEICDLPEAERDRALGEKCADDPRLLEFVAGLLRVDSTGLLKSPVVPPLVVENGSQLPA